MKKLHKLAAAVVAGGALFAAGGVAVAAPDQIVDTTKTNNEIHIVKYDDGAGQSAATGKQLDAAPTGAQPIEGIGFTLTPINGIDFSDNDSLKLAASLDAAKIAKGELPTGITLGNPIDLTDTNASGATDATGLPVGAYLLVEDDSTGKVAGGKEQTFAGAAPSIIFLPTTDPADTSKWLKDADGNYEVWVYPKNSVEENVKSVVDADVQAGGDVKFEVSASLPSPKPGEQISEFAFTDVIDPALDINGKAGDVTVTIGGETLTSGVDFLVWAEDGVENSGTQDKLTVWLTESGLATATRIKGENAAAKAVMSFKAKVLKAAVVPNQAQVYKNTGVGVGNLTPNPDTPPDTPPTPGPSKTTNTTVSAWGKVTVNKTDEADKPLAGAEFQIYECTVADGKGTIANEAQPITVKGETTFTTGASDADDPATQAVEGNGAVTVDGIHVNNVENDADVTTPTSYCLVETKAPAGYELRHDPIPFQVTVTARETIETKAWYDEQGVLIKNSTSTDIQEFNVDAAALHAQADVVNIKVKPKLPLTGGAGIAVFGLLGAFVIGGGLYAAKRNTRKAA